MSIPLNINGTDYFYPEQGDVNWGPDATDWATAVTSGMLQKAGGLFQLLAEVDFGPNYGLKSISYKTRSSNIADAGQFRLARTDVISWRNQANDANIDLGLDSSNQLTLNGVPVNTLASVSDTNSIDLTVASQALSADLKLSADTPDSGYILTDLSIETDGLKAQTLIFVGDSGSGGTAGVVPAPASGEAAKFLRGDGTWSNLVEVIDINSNHSALVSEIGSVFNCDTSSGAISITLPTPANGILFYIKDATGTFNVNALTLIRFGSEKIERITQNHILNTKAAFYGIYSDGTDWFLLGNGFAYPIAGPTVDDSNYSETISILIDATTPTLTLPTDSLTGLSAKYTVGKNKLMVSLNGQLLNLTDDYTEVGTVVSDQIAMTFDLVAGDTVNLRIK